jgi:hypothetical protein
MGFHFDVKGPHATVERKANEAYRFPYGFGFRA